MCAGVPATVAKAAAKQIKFLYLCYSTPLGTRRHMCDNSPKIADKSNTKILAQAHIGFNYTT